MAVATREIEQGRNGKGLAGFLSRLLSKREVLDKIEKPVKEKLPQVSEILSEYEIQQLKEKGYTPGEVIGQGNTRYVIRAVYQARDFKTYTKYLATLVDAIEGE
jgi:hypothetical protein